MKKSSFFYILILSFALIFSCTNVTNTDVVTQGKKTLAIPTFNTDDTKVEYGTIIKFSYSPSDANLYYTTDGTEPDLSSKDSIFYDPSRGIELKESCTIKARLYHSNYNSSPVVEKKFSVYIAEPTILPDSAEITTTDEIALSHKMFGTKIYYTTDGSEPTEDLDEYEKTFTLAAGTYTIKAIAIRGSVKSKIAEHIYTVIDANGAYLDKLEVVNGGKNYLENFSKVKTDYTINVPNNVDSVNIAAESQSCTVVCDSTAVLEEGSTKIITVIVTSKKDPTVTNLYKISIYRARKDASSDAALSDLRVMNNGTSIQLNPGFTRDTESYTAEVENSVSSVTLSFVLSNANAKTDIDSDTGFMLNVGKNILTVKVTAEDGVTARTYKIEVTRKDSETVGNANLKSVTVAGKAVTISDYMTVSSSDSTVRVVVAPEKDGATIKINNQSVTGLDVSVPSTVNIVVTDGTTTKTYTLDIKKASSAALMSLSVNGKNVTVGSMMNVNSDTASAEIIAVANGDVVSFTIDGKAAANGTACTVTVSTDGSSATKTVKIVLNANDGSTVSYDLVINYKAAITDKIILHVESKYKFIHYWVTGQTGTSKELTKESSSWNGCTLDITSVNLLLSTTDIINGNWSGKTDDLDRTAGEWWYKDGKWTDYNPEDSAPPTITWVSPADGESLSGIETLTVNAADDVGIEKIEFYADDKLIGTITTGSSFSWDSADVANGSHVLKAIAYDKAGNSTESNSVNVTTTNTNKAPVAIISSVGAIFVNTAKTFSAAESYDSNGSIISYAWNFGDGGKGSGVTASHTYTSAGNYTVTLTVTDNDNASKSATVSVKVNERGSFVHRDFREENVYFMMTDRFADGDKTNNNIWGDEYLPNGEADLYKYDESKTGVLSYYHGGDFKGIINNLDYIAEMGFTAIWITPSVKQPEGRYFYDGSGGGDAYEASAFHGYWGYDFDQIDPHLHSSGKDSDGWDDFKAFVDACHAKGIRVMQDVVINHGNHTAATAPTKWLSDQGTTIMDGKSWTWKTGDPYYDPDNLMNGFYAYTASWQCADLIDFGDHGEDGKDARQHMINVYKKFIDAGVDAFRIDTVAYVTNEWCGEFADAMYNHAKSLGNDYFYMIGEAWCGRYDAIARHSKDKTDSLHMLDMHLSCLDYPGEMSGVFKDGGDYSRYNSVVASDEQWGTDAQEHTWTGMFVDNHDCYRNNGIYSETQYKNALNYIYLFRGVPIVFYGTEAMYSWSGAHASTNKDDVVSRWMLGDQGINHVKTNKPGMYKHLKVLNKVRSASPCIQKGVQENVELGGDKAAFTRTFNGKTAYVGLSKGSAYSQTFSNVKSGKYTLYSSGSDGNCTETSVTVSGSYTLNVPANGFAFIEPK